jgi:tRNA (guanine10-N2)-dimethyltransferase
MKLIFEISKEHKTLPIAEITSCLKGEKTSYKIIEKNEDTIIIETKIDAKNIKTIANRLSYSYFISEFLFSSKPDLKMIRQIAKKKPIAQIGTIAIKYKNRSTSINSQEIVKTLADIYTKNRQVVLNNPDMEIRALITDMQIYTGQKIAEIDRRQYENRKVQNRPYFSPISLHPKLARALINLTSIKRRETLLDPFCGTGGILIEAGMIGVKVIGSDVEEKMIEGCKKNLEYYKIKDYELFHSDIGKIDQHIKRVDAIVTDLPYGKSTTTKGEKMEELYQRAFLSMSKILKDKGRAVIGLSKKEFLKIGEKNLTLLDTHEIRVHGSLTRYFSIFEK